MIILEYVPFPTPGGPKMKKNLCPYAWLVKYFDILTSLFILNIRKLSQNISFIIIFRIVFIFMIRNIKIRLHYIYIGLVYFCEDCYNILINGY